jgi:hypothetical protein
MRRAKTGRDREEAELATGDGDDDREHREERAERALGCTQLAVHDPIELSSSYLMSAGGWTAGDGKQKGRGALIYRGDGGVS